MIYKEMLNRIKEIAIQCLQQHGLELVEVSCHGKNRPTLRMLIDYPQGGINIEECAAMNDVISRALDETDIFIGGYILEVSSPGVDRPLKNKSDFLRVRNKKVRCFLKEPLDFKTEIEGLVGEAAEDYVTIISPQGNINLAYADITKAKQVID